MMVLPKPTPALVREKIGLFDHQNKVPEEALYRLLETFQSHTDPASVLLKVIAINRLYSTGIYAIHHVAKMIVQADIGQMLRDGKPEAIEKIRRVEFEDSKGVWQHKNIYSFATKYCTLHNPRDYAMYDELVIRTLGAYQKQQKEEGIPFCDPFGWEDLKNFPVFKAIVVGFRERFGLEDFTLREVDKFLWTLGGELYRSKPQNPSTSSGDGEPPIPNLSRSQ